MDYAFPIAWLASLAAVLAIFARGTRGDPPEPVKPEPSARPGLAIHARNRWAIPTNPRDDDDRDNLQCSGVDRP